MFYSHTFLARKGPMGTVWCAAHLQHRLKKTDYTRTNILSTVECIMYPEVPIALRMSGHLLLGVVRIYSKQVDYFFQECNYLELSIRKAFTTTNVNLPEGATQASYKSITLPETFQLDALESDHDLQLERFVDAHLRPQEEITLEDQIPAGGDQYVSIYIDEDMGRDLSPENNDATPMETDFHPPAGEGTSPGPQRSPHRSPTGQDEQAAQDGSPREIPEAEVMRDASHDVGPPSTPLWQYGMDDVLAPDPVLVEQVTKDGQNLSPVPEGMLPSGGDSLPPPQPHEHPSDSPDDGQGNMDSHPSFGNLSPDLAIRSSPPPPPPPPEQPRARQRKRKLLIDNALVLPNQVIKAGLNDTSHLKRERKEAPHSSLGIWRSNKRLKKDAVFFEPLITGQCGDLSNMHAQDFIFATALPSSTDEARGEGNGAQSSSSLGRDDMEVEHLRDYVGPTDDNILPEVLPMQNPLVPSPVTSMPSPNRQEEDFTPAAASLGEQSDPVGRTIDSVVLPTPDPAASTGNLHSDMDTPFTFPEEDVRFEPTALSDIPEFENSAGDLSFLEQDDNTPTGSQGTPEVGLSGKQRTPEFDGLSTRTRAVAQYLKGQSSTSPASEGQSSANPMPEPGDLSLFAVLEGKSRKICARMFYETLVLKNCGLIDVKQEEAYDDITLKATSKLLKEQV